jgi:hypothetical protein
MTRTSSQARPPPPVKMDVDNLDQIDQPMEGIAAEIQPAKPVAGPSSSGPRNGKGVTFKPEPVDSGDEIEYLSGTTPKKPQAPAALKRKVVDSDDDEIDQIMARECLQGVGHTRPTVRVSLS